MSATVLASGLCPVQAQRESIPGQAGRLSGAGPNFVEGQRSQRNVRKHLPRADTGAKSPTNERTTKAILPERRSVRKPTCQSAARTGASGHARTENIHRWALPLRALARLAHPEPLLVRDPAEVARPALTAESLTTAR
jgi:hypothetical protein